MEKDGKDLDAMRFLLKAPRCLWLSLYVQEKYPASFPEGSAGTSEKWHPSENKTPSKVIRSVKPEMLPDSCA